MLSSDLSAARSITARIAFVARALRSSGNGRPSRRRPIRTIRSRTYVCNFPWTFVLILYHAMHKKINSIPNIFPENRAPIPLFFRPRHYAGDMSVTVTTSAAAPAPVSRRI